MAKNESVLQKEFKERDVNRMRSLISGKYTEATGIQSGYSKAFVEHNEGDVWDERGKTWTIKNGIKMTVSKLDAVKKTLQTPLACPCCNKAMKSTSVNNKMYMLYKKCFDCVIDFETKLRQEGKYEEYQKEIISKNIYAYIADLEAVFEEYLLTGSNDESVVTEDGDVENWIGGGINKEKEMREFKEYIDKLRLLAETGPS